MWNVKLWTEEEYDDRMAKAELMFNYALELCELQSSKQLGFALENPVAASSWNLPRVTDALRLQNTRFVNFDQCRLGLTSPLGAPIKKRTRFLTNAAPVAQTFSLMQCNCTVPHTVVQGQELGHSLSTWSQIYPRGLSTALVQAAEDLP